MDKAPDPNTTPQGGTTPTSPQPSPSSQPEANADAIARSLQRLIDRSGGTDRAAELLFNENRDYRARIRELEGQLPSQGSVTLTPEQAQQWQAYQQLGNDPAALATALTQGREALEREQSRQLAEVSGASPTVLADLLRLSGVRAEVRDVPANGNQPARKAVHVLNAEGQDQGELRAWAEANKPDYLASLFPTTAQPQGGKVIAGQAGVGTAANGKDNNPIRAALGTDSKADAPVVSAFDFGGSIK